MSNEITVKLKCSIEEMDNILENKGFEIVDKFSLDDTYFVSKDIDINKMLPREILKHCILIREITQYMPELRIIKMTYKNKNIAPNGDIINQENVNCSIMSVEEGKKFLNVIGYNKIMNIKENDIVYEKDGFQIAVKDVKNGENLILPKQETIILNKYGRMRLNYLKEHKKAEYSIMLLDGTLNAHLKEIQETAQNRVEQIINKLKVESDLTEEMKDTDILYWVGTMNAIKNQAEEIVFNELIYV